MNNSGTQYYHSSYLIHLKYTAQNNNKTWPRFLDSVLSFFWTKWKKQGTHSNCIFKFYPTAIFPVPIHVICEYYIHKTDLADLSTLKKIFTSFAAKTWNIFYPIQSGNLQLEQTKFPVFWQNFQIPCVFPDREFFWPVFPVQWVPWKTVFILWLTPWCSQINLYDESLWARSISHRLKWLYSTTKDKDVSLYVQATT